MTARSPAGDAFRLRIRHGLDHSWRARLLGAESGLPPGMTEVEYELWARPPDRWRQVRLTATPEVPSGRDERLVDGERWYWLQPNHTVQVGEAGDPQPVTYRRLFQPADLLAGCRGHPAGTGEVAGRRTSVTVLEPLAPRDPRDLWWWGAGADRYRLDVDEEYGVVLRCEASGLDRVFQVDEVLEFSRLVAAPRGVFDFTPAATDVLCRHGDPLPGRLVDLARAARWAEHGGFALQAPRPLPPGARLRFWQRYAGDTTTPQVRIQVDFPDGDPVVLLEYAGGPGLRPRVDASGPPERVRTILGSLRPTG